MEFADSVPLWRGTVQPKVDTHHAILILRSPTTLRVLFDAADPNAQVTNPPKAAEIMDTGSNSRPRSEVRPRKGAAPRMLTVQTAVLDTCRAAVYRPPDGQGARFPMCAPTRGVADKPT